MFNPLNAYKYPAYLLGMVFVVSGLFKGIDPIGTARKIEEYFNLWNFSTWWFAQSEACSIMLSALELFWGLCLLLLIYRKVVAAITIILMSFLTLITAYIAFIDSGTITDCGCFGELFELSNVGTFVKNVILLFVAFLYKTLLVYIVEIREVRMYRFGLFVSLVLAFFVPIYSYFFLPPVEYLLTPMVEYHVRVEYIFWTLFSAFAIIYFFIWYIINKKQRHI